MLLTMTVCFLWFVVAAVAVWGWGPAADAVSGLGAVFGGGERVGGTWARGSSRGSSRDSSPSLPTLAPPTASGLARVPAASDHVLSANGISIHFAKRLAGAVWTMRWRGHDFVGVTEGNGGSQQSALGYDLPPNESPEVENPTEAGSVNDNAGATTSQWTEAARSGTEMFTRTRMAYFIPPGAVVPSSPFRTRGRGASGLSDTTLTKRVSIGHRGHANVVRYVLHFQASRPHWFAQIEALTGYMPDAFSQLYTVENGRARRQPGTQYRASPPAPAHPIILAKSAGVALGVYADAAPPNPLYRPSPWYSADTRAHGGHEPGTLRPVSFSKWNVVWQTGSRTPGAGRIATSFVFGICLVLGSVDECAATIAALQTR